MQTYNILRRVFLAQQLLSMMEVFNLLLFPKNFSKKPTSLVFSSIFSNYGKKMNIRNRRARKLLDLYVYGTFAVCIFRSTLITTTDKFEEIRIVSTQQLFGKFVITFVLGSISWAQMQITYHFAKRKVSIVLYNSNTYLETYCQRNVQFIGTETTHPHPLASNYPSYFSFSSIMVRPKRELPILVSIE